MGRIPGAIPKPTERKRAVGNPGRRPLPEPVVALPPAETTPDPLRPLGPTGTALWDRTWDAGAAAWISDKTDIELLMNVCEALDERQTLRRLVLEHGDDKERKALRTLDAQIIDSLSLLGLTPADRARLGIAEVMAQSTLERLKRARDASRSRAVGS